MNQQVEIQALAASAVFDVVVPFDGATGRVYLNAIGSTRSEAELPFAAGAIEMSDDELENLDFIESKLVLVYGSEADLGLFPVSVPIDRHSGKPLLSATGSSDVEARVNLDFLNKDADAYLIAAAGIEMPLLLENRSDLPKLAG